MWFPEPDTLDPTYCGRREAPVEWLSRSTVTRAVECRRFLNDNLNAFALADQERFVHDLRHRWDSAFFELVVARVLQLLGGSVSIEAANSGGHRPDFRVTFADSAIIVEAVAPLFDATASEHTREQAPLLDIVESFAPAGWALCIRDLPRIGPRGSKRAFKTAVREMLAVGAPTEGQEAVTVARDTDDGMIEFLLIPSANDQGLASWGGTAFWDNTEDRIRRALKRKRRQVRDSAEPVLLAVRASGMVSSLEDFDRAVFGRTCTDLGLDLEVVGQRFEADGLFARDSLTDPTYAGLLAFTAVGFNVCTQPVVYRHPRFRGELPRELAPLEERAVDLQQARVVVRPAIADDVLAGLKLVEDWTR